MVTSSPDRARPPARPVVTIDIYSDVVCPWCYIGKRKFEAGLDLLAGEDLGVDFDVTYRPFQLDPTAAPGAAQPVIETYAKKFGGPERAAEILADGHRAGRGGRHRIPHGPRPAGQHPARPPTALVRRSARVTGRAGRPEGASAAGLLHRRAEHRRPGRARRLRRRDRLRSGRGRRVPRVRSTATAEVAAELAEGRDEGITAVPTFVFDGRWAVPGAQEPETYRPGAPQDGDPGDRRQRRLNGYMSEPTPHRIILAHGFTQTAASWETFAGLLADAAADRHRASPWTCPGTGAPTALQADLWAERRPSRAPRRSGDVRRLLDGRTSGAARRARPSGVRRAADPHRGDRRDR